MELMSIKHSVKCNSSHLKRRSCWGRSGTSTRGTWTHQHTDCTLLSQTATPSHIDYSSEITLQERQALLCQVFMLPDTKEVLSLLPSLGFLEPVTHATTHTHTSPARAPLSTNLSYLYGGRMQPPACSRTLRWKWLYACSAACWCPCLCQTSYQTSSTPHPCLHLSPYRAVLAPSAQASEE